EGRQQRKFSRKKIDLIKSLDLLIIDEISMVRADLLDAIDEVLQRLRGSKLAFGGVQLLMIGDLHQLPPVVKQEDWNMLRDHYQTAYFFGSLALQETRPITIKLTHIYRQSDDVFIELLNKVRKNQLDKEVLDTLNSRYIPNFKTPEEEAYIILTSHNKTADAINQEKLDEIDAPIRTYNAEVEGNFPESNYPTAENLELKKGAQVLFIKNDMSFEKRFYNGKIGQVVDMNSDTIFVRCPNESELIEVSTMEWTNVKYSLNQETKEVEEEVLGVFTQFPLKLAWAITIHKSQGLTFERAIIDAQAAFAHGQVYVALSRCKSFEGIVLRSPIAYSSVKTDIEVQHYSQRADQNAPDEKYLEQSKRTYQQKLIRDLFNFYSMKRGFENLERIFLEHENTLTTTALQQVTQLKNDFQDLIFNIAQKFEPRLEQYFKQKELPEENDALQARLQKAGGYFADKLQHAILPELKRISILSDNQAIQKRIFNGLEYLEKAIFIKKRCFLLCQTLFSTQDYIKIKTNADLDFASEKRKTAITAQMDQVPSDVKHPELYAQLLQWRQEEANSQGVSAYDILYTRILVDLVKALPTEKKTLKKVKGIGPAKVRQYGKDIIQIIEQYCEEKDIASNLLAISKKDTKKVSFELFLEGKSVEEIAAERNLVSSTIEGHLAHFVQLGELSITELIDDWKVEEVEDYFRKTESEALSEAKTFFGEKYSYGELRLLLAHWKAEKEKK
ncbi:MAG: helix-turn-helix domain-containing protein, partial [Bacteroidota bacterium]